VICAGRHVVAKLRYRLSVGLARGSVVMAES
jgi:hypothetical protein